MLISFLLLSGIFFLLLKDDGKRNPNIILISIDTMRADHLGCYGYGGNTSPNIDEFSKTSVLFEKFFSHSPSTTPSHASMLSSLYVLSHGIRANAPGFMLSDHVRTLSEVLKEHGYKTAAFTGDAWLSQAYGFSRGFDKWSEKYRNIPEHLPLVKEWIKNNRENKFFLFFHFYDVHSPYLYRKELKKMYQNPGFTGEIEKLDIKVKKAVKNKEDLEKFFAALSDSEKGIAVLYSYTISLLHKRLHAGNVQGVIRKNFAIFSKFYREEWEKIPDYTKQLQFLIDSYDAGIRKTDMYIGEFFKFLKKSELWDNTLIILTSDHGEEFMENKKLGHEGNLYDTLLHVPFIIKMPDNSRGKAKRIAVFAESVDIMPTILDFLGIYPGSVSQMQGKSVLGLIENRTSVHKDMVFASVSSRQNQSNPKAMVRNDKIKCILPSINRFKGFRFYVIGNDSLTEQQLHNISRQEKDRLINNLKKHIARCSMLYRGTYSKKRQEIGKNKKDIPQEVKKNLKSLGYIN